VRQEARKFALQAIDVQKEEFKQLGIMADWDVEGGVYRSLGEFAPKSTDTNSQTTTLRFASSSSSR
jgi:hypothetical protein